MDNAIKKRDGQRGKKTRWPMMTRCFFYPASDVFAPESSEALLGRSQNNTANATITPRANKAGAYQSWDQSTTSSCCAFPHPPAECLGTDSESKSLSQHYNQRLSLPSHLWLGLLVGVDHSCHKEEVIANAMQQDANEDRGGHHWAILTKSKAP